MGGGGQPDIPKTPWKERVQWIDSDYTSWDKGKTWVNDPNYHFFYGGQNYYVTSMDDVEYGGPAYTGDPLSPDGAQLPSGVPSGWKIDTLSDFHHSEDQHTAYLKGLEAEAAAREAHEAQMRSYGQQEDYMRAMMASMEEAAAQRNAYYSRLQSEQEAANQEAATKEARRRKLAGMGRSNLNLTGGRGADMEDAKILKRKLGGGAKTGARA
jgi:hypothetical protein